MFVYRLIALVVAISLLAKPGTAAALAARAATPTPIVFQQQAVVQCLAAFTRPAFSKRSFLAWTRALLGRPLPPIEIINRARVRAARIRKVYWDFDNTLWQGFPNELEARLTTTWLLNQSELQENDVAKIRQKLKDTTGMQWTERLDKLRDEGYFIPLQVFEYLERQSIVMHEAVRDRGMTSPAYLTPGAESLLKVLRQAGVRQGILTGGNAEVRDRYSRDLGIDSYFDLPTLGDGEKEKQLRQQVESGQLDPQSTAVVDDGIIGIQAARAVEMLAIGYAKSPEDRQVHINDGAEIIINSNFLATDEIMRQLPVDQIRRSSERNWPMLLSQAVCDSYFFRMLPHAFFNLEFHTLRPHFQELVRSGNSTGQTALDMESITVIAFAYLHYVALVFFNRSVFKWNIDMRHRPLRGSPTGMVVMPFASVASFLAGTAISVDHPFLAGMAISFITQFLLELFWVEPAANAARESLRQSA